MVLPQRMARLPVRPYPGATHSAGSVACAYSHARTGYGNRSLLPEALVAGVRTDRLQLLFGPAQDQPRARPMLETSRMITSAGANNMRVLHIVGDSRYGGVARIILGLGRVARANGWQ